MKIGCQNGNPGYVIEGAQILLGQDAPHLLRLQIIGVVVAGAQRIGAQQNAPLDLGARLKLFGHENAMTLAARFEREGGAELLGSGFDGEGGFLRVFGSSSASRGPPQPLEMEREIITGIQV